jgi:hypothetical protein
MSSKLFFDSEIVCPGLGILKNILPARSRIEQMLVMPPTK